MIAHHIAPELITYGCCNSVCIAIATPTTNIKYKATQKSVCFTAPIIHLSPYFTLNLLTNLNTKAKPFLSQNFGQQNHISKFMAERFV